MPAVKIPESLREELERMDLTVWQAMHPMRYDNQTASDKGRGRHDKDRVMVQLAGPGLADYSPWGYGGNVREAVDDALRHPEVIGRVGGLKGAIMRLDAAIGPLIGIVRLEAWNAAGGWEDEIPF